VEEKIAAEGNSARRWCVKEPTMGQCTQIIDNRARISIYARVNGVHEGQMDKRTFFFLITYIVRAVLDRKVWAWLAAGGCWKDKGALSKRRLSKYEDGICWLERKKYKERKILEERYWEGASGVQW
jgi:hypothetical protein